MEWIIYALSVFIILCLLLIWYVNTYNRYQQYIIRINEAETSIDSNLRKRFDLLNKSISIIKANADIKGEILEDIVKLRSRKLSNFELDRSLYDSINEFDRYREEYPNLRESENFIKIEIGLNDSEAVLDAAKMYYNDIITDYNKLIRTFPSNMVGKLARYKEKPYFDGKNFNAEDKEIKI